ncbi:MAG TPA: DoxX family membrane protein [Candidatus Sulfotelmatobacter sp.]|nr:DoxX family membrane protein [Candidatus Sulfotelmatobacter sp.]
MEFLKGAKGSWIWLVFRLYLGYQWFEAGWHKFTGATPFDAAGFIKGGVAKIIPPATLTAEQLAKFKPITATWWGNFLNNFALPNVKLFNFMVMYGEILVGLALIVGFATLFACWMAIIMNFSFLMTGSTSSSPYLMVLAFMVVAWGGAYAGYLGVDYWFRPWLRSKLSGLFGNAPAAAKSAA